MLACVGYASAQVAVTYDDEAEWKAYDDFNNAFLDKTRNIYKADTKQPNADHRGNGYRDNDVSGCAAAIWCQAIMYDMVINAYNRAILEGDRTRANKYKKLHNSIYNGEKAHYVNFDFDNPDTNNGWFVYDDIMWWVAALARAAAVDAANDAPPYLDLAEKAFHRVWYGSPKVGDTGSYADPAKGLGGGMFWQWQPIPKARPNKAGDFRSACITFPTIIACCLLHDRVPATRTEGNAARPTRAFYKAKAIELYAWGRTTLVPDGARVADGIHKGGPEFHDHLYNQATYLGAACLLHRLTGEARYLADARRAADYIRDTMCRPAPDGTRLLPVERGPEQGVYAAIFAQYMDLLVHDRGQKQYLPWLRANITAGWRNRDARGLQDARLGRPLRPGADVQSYDASALPALQLLFD